MVIEQTRIFSGERRITSLPGNDRGLAYGDGLFETMRAHRGALPWWEAHWTRLANGAGRLGMALPDADCVREQATALLADRDGVLKLLVTRGAGRRGYAPDGTGEPTWVLSFHPGNPGNSSGEAGLSLRWCRMRLAIQPALAGLKHCNRLEQVLARAEWAVDRSDADEGLMRSTEGDVVCATAANLFLLRDGRWSTPRIDRCGVAGVCRAWLLAATDATQARVTVRDVESADALILCNAVRGILPVARLGSRTWLPHDAVVALQARLAREQPAFATTMELS